MEGFIELLVKNKKGVYVPRCVRVWNIVGVRAVSYADEHPVVLVKEGHKIERVIVEESYLELRARLGILEVLR